MPYDTATLDSSNLVTLKSMRAKMSADWTKIPDLLVATLLGFAFSSVARNHPTPFARYWLVAWALIMGHFAAQFLEPQQGIAGISLEYISLVTLTTAGVCFMRAALKTTGSRLERLFFYSLATIYGLYLATIYLPASDFWFKRSVAVLFIAQPVLAAALSKRKAICMACWIAFSAHILLGLFLLLVQEEGDAGQNAAVSATLFVVYFSCATLFALNLERQSTGAMLTILGFLSWSSVFVLAPTISSYWPEIHLEGEIWNLPKYVAAIGMILLTLEKQVKHNQHLALHDALTGLPNRRLFQDRLSNALERARRSNTSTALLVVDMNHFKLVNDTLGHHAGDLLLKHVARVLESRMRRSDTVARTGGDEFSIIIEEPVSQEEAEQVSAALLAKLREPLTLLGKVVQCDASIGLGIFPVDAADAESLCILADLRMYAAKRECHARDAAEQPEVQDQPEVVHLAHLPAVH